MGIAAQRLCAWYTKSDFEIFDITEFIYEVGTLKVHTSVTFIGLLDLNDGC